MFDVFTELQEAKIAFKEHLSGKELTTYRAGGKVSVVAYPESVAALKKLVGIAMETGTKFMPIGLGSNVLIDEKGFDGILISSIGFRDISIRGNRIPRKPVYLKPFIGKGIFPEESFLTICLVCSN